jgi:hypothetical protein
VISYFAGGYVAGRMSRFDGGRQGFGVWALAVVMAVLLAIAGAIFGSEYNLFGELDLPRIPIDEGTLATVALITLLLVLALTALAAILGGRVGGAITAGSTGRGSPAIPCEFVTRKPRHGPLASGGR